MIDSLIKNLLLQFGNSVLFIFYKVKYYSNSVLQKPKYKIK